MRYPSMSKVECQGCGNVQMPKSLVPESQWRPCDTVVDPFTDCLCGSNEWVRVGDEVPVTPASQG
jgi:hypothetical protein